MRKRIAAYLKEYGPDRTLFEAEEYWQSYQDLNEEVAKQGGELYIVSNQETYLGQGRFSRSWQIKDGQLASSGAITADLVYDRGIFDTDGKVPIFNSQYVTEVCTNKWQTCQIFTEFCPQTFVVESDEELKKVMKSLPGPRKVIKPLTGEKGDGVYIGEEEYLLTSKHSFPLLVQEFVDTSSGIPGIYVGIHDLRMVLMNGKIYYAYYRIPKAGSLLANVAQGGQRKFMALSDLPGEAVKVADAVRAHFKGKYSVGLDVGFVKTKPVIFELNSRTGLLPVKRGPEFKTFMEDLVRTLVNF